MSATNTYIEYFNNNGMFRPIFPGPGGYTANAVNFDGVDTGVFTNSGLSGIADGPLGTISVWIKFNAGYAGGTNNYQQIFGADANLAFTLARTGSNWGANAAIGIGLAQTPTGPAQTLRIRTVALYPNATGWMHIFSSWNTNAAPDRVVNLMVDGVQDIVGGGDSNAFDVDYHPFDYSVAAQGAPSTLKFPVDIADLYFSTEYLDPHDPVTYSKFVDGNGNPVYLGADGSRPSGNQPVVFFSGDASQWNINKGYGQGFSKTEPLTNSLTSPSD